jgi:hypothetical protein
MTGGIDGDKPPHVGQDKIDTSAASWALVAQYWQFSFMSPNSGAPQLRQA